MTGRRRPRLGLDTARGAARAGGRITVVADDPAAIAERCWDAGFEVRVRGPADGGAIVVIGLLEVELEVIPRRQPVRLFSS
jgi:hypothetical protein